jgi:hypothetical protein
MMRSLNLLQPGAVKAVPRLERNLARFVLCGLLTSSSIVSGATLAGHFDTPWDGIINLSEEGTLDWGHWGLVTEWTYNHKYGVPQQITCSFLTVTGYAGWPGPVIIDLIEPRYGGTMPFGWNDGTPSGVIDYTFGGVTMYGDKLLPGSIPAGFHIECPADTSPKTLRLYLGNSWGRGTVTASLNGAATYSDVWLDGNDGGVNKVYTFDFEADSPGQTLTVEYTCVDPTWYITLQAATLAGTNSRPAVAITAPADGAAYSAPATFTLTASASDADGTVTNLSLFRGSTLLKQSASGNLGMTLSNLPPGAYDFLAVAKDNGGSCMTSSPVRVYLKTSGGTLTGSVDMPPYELDLTAEGTNDWAHWGLDSALSFNHKAGVIQRIPNVTLLNASGSDLTNYTDNLTAYTWADGTPTPTAYSWSGIMLFTTNPPFAGFQLTVPATNYLRTLKLYVGLSYANGKLDAWLSDYSALPYSDASIYESDNNGYAVYTLTFSSANRGANLIVTWTPVEVFNLFYANLSWQAATLSEQEASTQQRSPPLLRVIAPPPTTSLAFYSQTGATYAVQFTTNPGSTNWQALTNLAGTGAEAVVIDRSPGTSRRFYRVLMQ